MQLKKKISLSNPDLYKLEIDCLQLCHINSYLLQTRPTLCAAPFQNTSLNPLLRQHFLACPIVIATSEPPIANVSVAVKFSSFTGSTNLPGVSPQRSSELHVPVRAHICQQCRPDTHVNKVLFFTLILVNMQETFSFFVYFEWVHWFFSTLGIFRVSHFLEYLLVQLWSGLRFCIDEKILCRKLKFNYTTSIHYCLS